MDWIGITSLIAIFVVSYLYAKFAFTPKGPDWKKLGQLLICMSGVLAVLFILAWFFEK